MKMTNRVYLVGNIITGGTLHSLDYHAAFFLLFYREWWGIRERKVVIYSS